MIARLSPGSYEYANARIRGMRGRLLPAAEVQALILQPGLTEFVARLEQTDYEQDLKLARERLPGIALVEDALRHNLSRRLRDVRHFFSPSPSEGESRAARLVTVILGRYDARNLLAIFRGRARGLAWAETQGAILPSGALDVDQLALLSEESSSNEIIRLLRRWSFPFAERIADVVAVDYDSPLQFELALLHSFWDWASEEVKGRDANCVLVRNWLAIEADAVNLMTVVRLVRGSTRPDAAGLARLLVPGGTLPFSQMAALLDKPTEVDVIAALGSSPLGVTAAAAARRMIHPDQAVALEWGIEQWVGRWARAQAYRDPLGIGVLLAYHAAKIEEVRLLRLIARGLEGRWPRQRLQDFSALLTARGGSEFV